MGRRQVELVLEEEQFSANKTGHTHGLRCPRTLRSRVGGRREEGSWDRQQ